MTIEAGAGLSMDELVKSALVELEKKDPEWLAREKFWIKAKSGLIAPMGRLKLAQRKVLAVLRWQRKRREPVRVIIAKSRKQGVSTVIAQDATMQVWRNQIDALVVSYDKASAHKIFAIYNRFYEMYDLEKPALYKGNKNLREMRFDGHDGKIEVETAGNIYAGTAITPQYLHCSETSKWEHGEETLTSLLQSIGDEPGTTLIFESTFNGQESTFLPLWEGAVKNSRLEFKENPDGSLAVRFEVTNKREWNGYIPIFIPAFDDETASRMFEDEDDKERFVQTLDDYERNVMEVHGGNLEFLNWRRWVFKQKCQSELSILKQEYPITWQEAVQASGRARFDVEKLDTHIIEAGSRGRLAYSEGWDKKVVWKPDPGETLVRFREPQPRHFYCVGVDTAGGGLEEQSGKPDNTVIEVLDKTAGGEEVACFEAGTVTPEGIGAVLNMIGRYYNNAYLVIESNGQGAVLCRAIVELGYPQMLLYHRDDYNPDRRGGRRAVGFNTSSYNRNDLISALADALNDDKIALHDERAVMECKRFVYKAGGRIEAATGYKDDHVVALCLACIGMRASANVRQYEEVFNSRQAEERYQQARKSADPVTGY